MVLSALFAALTVVGGRLTVPVQPVPFTLQSFVTALSGVLLGPYWSALSQAVYVLLGLVGLPVFSEGGGFTYLFSPTFGYLLGFIVSSFLTGLLVRRAKRLTFPFALLACVAGMLAMYLLAVPWMYFSLRLLAKTIPFEKALLSGFLLFLPTDLLKCAAAALIGCKLRPALRRAF